MCSRRARASCGSSLASIAAASASLLSRRSSNVKLGSDLRLGGWEIEALGARSRTLEPSSLSAGLACGTAFVLCVRLLMALFLRNVETARFIPICVFGLANRSTSEFIETLRGALRSPDRSSQQILRCGQAAYVVNGLATRVARRSVHTVSALHHLALGTQDVARLAEFYRDQLGLREVARHDHENGSLRSVWLDLGGSLLMIEPTTEGPRNVVGVGAGPFLIAIAIEPEQRERVEARLAAINCSIEARSEWTSYARDPDGNRIALSAYPLAALLAR
jgi:catechol 2,3-dioxygenase-like lactoylglutathione lyase family enzyme